MLSLDDLLQDCATVKIFLIEKREDIEKKYWCEEAFQTLVKSVDEINC